MPSTYRPSNPDHNYYDRGIYLIMLIVSGHTHLISHFVTDSVAVLGHESSHNPVCLLLILVDSFACQKTPFFLPSSKPLRIKLFS